MLAWPCKQLPSLGFSPVTTVGAESSLTSNLKEVCQQTALTPDLQIVMSKKIHSQICGKPRNVNSSQTQTCKRYCIRYIHFIPPFMKVEYLNKVTTEKKKNYLEGEKFCLKTDSSELLGLLCFIPNEIMGTKNVQRQNINQTGTTLQHKHRENFSGGRQLVLAVGTFMWFLNPERISTSPIFAFPWVFFKWINRNASFLSSL